MGLRQVLDDLSIVLLTQGFMLGYTMAAIGGSM